MPIIENSSFAPAFYLKNPHVQTLYSACFRKTEILQFSRERIPTNDSDFLDLDWSRVGSDSLAILSHGLEGSSSSSYILGMSLALNGAGWDSLAWNYRGCSREANKTLKMYHSGATYDLEQVCQHVENLDRYRKVVLIGFSLGANLSLLYLSEERATLKNLLKACIAFSAPCDLAASTKKMTSGISRIYQKHFVDSLKKKIKIKHSLFPEAIDIAGLDQIKTFEEFDDTYIAPIHGFRDAKDYWEKCSSLKKLERIKTQSLIISALDDPILDRACFPFEQARNNSKLFLETPKHGGHNGFIETLIGGKSVGRIWSEVRALRFIEERS